MRILPLILFLFVAISAHAVETLSYSGRLINDNGSPVTGNVNLRFELAYSGQLSVILCSQELNAVELAQGVFHVRLHFPGCNLTAHISQMPVGDTLSIRVKDITTTTPKAYSFQSIHAVPFAINAKISDQLVQMGAASGQVLTWNGNQWIPVSIDTIIDDGGVTNDMLAGNISRSLLAAGSPDHFIVNDSSGNLSSIDNSAVRMKIGAMAFTDVELCLSHQKLQMNPGPVFWSCVDDLTEDDTKLPLAGGTLTGALILKGDPGSDLEATTKAYVDSVVNAIDPAKTGTVKIKANGYYVELMGNSGIASDLQFILPSSKGSLGEALVTDGNGNLSWAAPAAANSSSIGGQLSGTLLNATINNNTISTSTIINSTIIDEDISPTANISQNKILGLGTSLDSKENIIAPGSAGQYLDGEKNWITLDTSKIPEDSTNLYFTDSRARSAISANGPLSFNNATGEMSFLSSGTVGNLLRSDGTTWESWSPDYLTTEADNLQTITDRGATTTAFSKFSGGASFSKIGIGTDSPVGVFDIQSSTSGILIPRMTGTQRNGIVNPTGMQIYNTETNRINFHDGSGWKELGVAGSGVQSVATGTGLVSDTITSSGTINVDVGTSFGKIVQVDVGDKLPVIDGSQLTNLNPLNIGSTIPVSKGGTGLTSFVNNRVYVSNGSGALTPFTCGTTQLFGFDASGTPTCINFDIVNSLEVKQDGNSFGVPMVVGTNDTQSLSFETQGTNKMTVLPNGNVGIGTTGPTQIVDVVKATGDGVIRLKTNEVDSDAGIVLQNDAQTWKINNKAGYADAFTIQDVTSGIDAMIIKKSTGNVGIGTTSPVQKLHLNSGNFEMSSDHSIGVNIGSTTSEMSFYPYYTSVTSLTGLGPTAPFPQGMVFKADQSINIVETDANALIGYFDVNNKNFVWDGHTITNSLEVAGAINTKSGSKTILHHSTNATGIPDGDGFRIVYDGSAFGTNYDGLIFEKTDGNAPAADGGIGFAMRPMDGVRTMVMSIRGNGRVGIGTVNPSYVLHVVGTAGLSTGTAWTNASDFRLKDISGNYENGLEEILKLRTVKFHYKKDNPLELPSDKEIVGFVAQEVREVIPEAVTERDDGYLELNVDPIHWAMVNGIQELNDHLVDARKQVRDNKRLVASLEEIIDNLRSREIKKEQELEILRSENNAIKAYLCEKDPEAPMCK